MSTQPGLGESLPIGNKKVRLLVRYLVSGGTGIVIQTVSLFIWVSLLKFEQIYLVGVVCGFVLALTTLFILQKYWVFRDSALHRTPHQLLSYTAVALLGLALNALLLTLAKHVFELFSLDFFHGWYIVVQIGVAGIVSLFNFSMNFIFTFRHARQERLWEH